MKHLADHNCPDITHLLDLPQCGTQPIAGGGFGDIYWGTLNDGTNVAIKCVRTFFGSDAEGSKALEVSYSFMLRSMSNIVPACCARAIYVVQMPARERTEPTWSSSVSRPTCYGVAVDG